MPIEFRYDPEKKALFGAMTSPLSLDEYRSTVAAIVQSEEFPPEIRTLWDLRELEFTAIDRGFEEKLISISEQFPQRSPAKVAFVVKNELGYGMIRMFEMLAEKLAYRTMVFKSYSAGEEWLLWGD
jgi:hypothetical protein